MAAAFDGMVPSPRSIAASLACARRRFAPAAADAVMCLCVAHVWLWLWFAGMVAVGTGRVAGTVDCPMVVAASKVLSFCELYLLYSFVIAMMLFLTRVDKYDANEEKVHNEI